MQGHCSQISQDAGFVAADRVVGTLVWGTGADFHRPAGSSGAGLCDCQSQIRSLEQCLLVMHQAEAASHPGSPLSKCAVLTALRLQAQAPPPPPTGSVSALPQTGKRIERCRCHGRPKHGLINNVLEHHSSRELHPCQSPPVRRDRCCTHAGTVSLTINMLLSGYGILPWTDNGTASVSQALLSEISPAQREPFTLHIYSMWLCSFCPPQSLCISSAAAAAVLSHCGTGPA